MIVRRQPLVSIVDRFAFGKRARAGQDPHERRHYARLSDLAYKDDMTRHVGAQQLGLNYDRELSNSQTAVFNGNGRTVVSFRGTVPSDMKDLSADASILMSVQKAHPRFQESVDHTKKVVAKYGPNVVLTGHSLGGSIADHVSKETDLPAVVYNPGSSPHTSANPSIHTTVYRNPTDIVSSGYGAWPVPVAVGLAGFGSGAHRVEQFYDQ